MTTTTEITHSNGVQNGNANQAPLQIVPVDFAERSARAIDDLIGKGDLTKMLPAEKVNYYRRVCESLGLNPLTKPFEYVQLPGGLKFYATKGCADQLRKINKVSIPLNRLTKSYDAQTGLFEVWVTAVLPDGREDTDVGVVSLKGLQGENLANALMKTITKAKRRVTLSICGLGWLDETEVDSIPGARIGGVDVETGEEVESRPAAADTRRAAPRPLGSTAQHSSPSPASPSPASSHQPFSNTCEVCEKPMPPGQVTLSMTKYGRPLCPVHQRSGEEATPAAQAPAAADRSTANTANDDPFDDEDGGGLEGGGHG